MVNSNPGSPGRQNPNHNDLESESEDESPLVPLPADPAAAAVVQLNQTLSQFSKNMKVQALSATLRDMPHFSGKPEEVFEDHLERYNRYCQRLRLSKRRKFSIFLVLWEGVQPSNL